VLGRQNFHLNAQRASNVGVRTSIHSLFLNWTENNSELEMRMKVKEMRRLLRANLPFRGCTSDSSLAPQSTAPGSPFEYPCSTPFET
jgi:hypothetical protein